MAEPSVVFITNVDKQKSYSGAAEYGSIRAVTTGNYPIFKTSRLIEEIAAILIHSKPEDFLLISGSGTVAGLCLAMWLERHKVAKILIWDSKKYSMRLIKRETLRGEIAQAEDALRQRQEAGTT